MSVEPASPHGCHSTLAMGTDAEEAWKYCPTWIDLQKGIIDKRTRDTGDRRVLAVDGCWHKAYETWSRKNHNRYLEGACHGQQFSCWIEGQLGDFELNIRRMKNLKSKSALNDMAIRYRAPCTTLTCPYQASNLRAMSPVPLSRQQLSNPHPLRP